jgi:hypothetical protein
VNRFRTIIRSLMNSDAYIENARTLAQIIGTSQQNAAELLDGHVGVFVDTSDDRHNEVADFLVLLLERTVSNIHKNPDTTDGLDMCVCIGSVPNLEAVDLFVGIDPEKVLICSEKVPIQATTNGSNQIWALTGACYTAAQVVRKLVGDLLPVPKVEHIQINYIDIFGETFHVEEEFDIGITWLVGAGAIGNAFVFALNLLNPKGELHVVDPDAVDGGNLNRCLCFGEKDLELNKAKQLSEWLKARNPSLRVYYHGFELAKVPEKSDGPWLPRLVVAVDSRIARRNIQNEIPGEVYDASTTDIREFVLHFNSQPLEGRACLSCIYFQDVAEDAHKKHVAEALGVTLEDLDAQFVSTEAATKIKIKNPDVADQILEGLAYDSLFKQLCGEGRLSSAEDRQVFAPFAFVSVMAGLFLAIEFKKRILKPKPPSFNYWKVSPWSSPVLRGQRNKFALKDCSFCSNSVMESVAKSLWARK